MSSNLRCRFPAAVIHLETDQYIIWRNVPSLTGEALVCRFCGVVTFHPEDIHHRYCPRCKSFLDKSPAAPNADVRPLI
ncbi:MAG: hypothetical protein U0Z53_29140 [Blastocatellia bacterium]